MICTIVELLMKYMEERIIMELSFSSTLFLSCFPCFKLGIHLTVLMSNNLLEDRKVSYSSLDAPPCLTSTWFKATVVNVCSLGLNCIIPPKRYMCMLTKALENLTGRINDGIPGM